MNPVLVFPWQRPFLPDLLDFLDEVSHGRPGNALLLTPHNRPARYLAQLYARRGHVGALPRVMPLAEAVAFWRAREGGALRAAGDLDRVAVLHQCVALVARDDPRLATRFAGMDVARFLPWGLRLSDLFEDIFLQNAQAQDLTHVEEEVAGPAAALLGALGRIGQAYETALARKGWTTPGLDARAVAGSGGAIPPFFSPGPDRPVVMAGFAQPAGSEEALLRRLWRAGGHVCLHADARLSEGTGFHWACHPLHAWMRRWNAEMRLAAPPTPEEAGRRSRLRFFAGYDVHSQMLALREDLAADGDGADRPSTAVVLASSALLVPVLHHLPRKDVNISMGYPLERSPLNHLLEAVLRLGEQSRGAGGGGMPLFHWRGLLQCLRHPYLNLLRARDAAGQALSLRPALRRLEAAIRQGRRFVDWAALAADCAPHIPGELRPLLDEMGEVLLARPAAAATTAQMADSLAGICQFLLRHADGAWERFPLDAEAMYRLTRHALPQLRRNCLADTPLPAAALHGIVRQTLRRERVPFEAEPLTGLQVLGMLETRLLHFDRVFLMDATDDQLPGNAAQDPLLPSSLRQALGLPDDRARERVTAYNLYRLCAGARDVRFLWQEGISRSALFDGKKSRSRFVEQMLWDEERRRGALARTGDGLVVTAPCVMRPSPPPPDGLPRSQGLDAAMRRILSRPLSATRLDVYQQCPQRFVWQCLCRLAPPAEVNEGDDPAAVGICIHETLRALFTPYLGRECRRGDISRETLLACFADALEKADLRRQLPPDSCLLLEEAAPERLWQFLQKQPEATVIEALEAPLAAALDLAGQRYAFKGVMDRLDRRDGFLHVLDYKTGALKRHESGLWTDIALFRQAEGICEQARLGPLGRDGMESLDALFAQLQARLPSLQLPAYLLMAEAAGLSPLADAALVDLRESGEERPLFGGLVDEDLAAALRHCRLALGVTLLHMRHAPRFTACRGDACQWCPYPALCAGRG